MPLPSKVLIQKTTTLRDEMRDFLLLSAVFLILSGTIASHAAAEPVLVRVVNECLITSFGLCLVVHFRFSYALIFLLAQAALVCTLIGQQQVSISLLDDGTNYVLTILVLFAVDRTLKSERRNGWPEAAAIAITGAGLVTGIVTYAVPGFDLAITALSLTLVMPAKIGVLFFCFFLHVKFSNRRTLTSHRASPIPGNFSKFFIGAVLIFTVSISAIIWVSASRQITNAIGFTESRLRTENSILVQAVEQIWNSSLTTAISFTAHFSSRDNQHFSQETLDVISQLTSLRTVLAKTADESIRTIYHAPNTDGQESNFESLRMLPCPIRAFNCKQILDVNTSALRTSPNNSTHLYFFFSTEELFGSLREPWLFIEKETDRILFTSEPAKKIRQDLHFTVSELIDRKFDTDNRKRAWLIYSINTPELGMRISSTLNRAKHLALVSFKSLKPEASAIFDSYLGRLISSIAVSLLLQCLFLLFLENLINGLLKQLRKIEDVSLSPAGSLSGPLSQDPEITKALDRIQSAAKTREEEISEQIKLGQTIMLERTQLTEMLDAALSLSVIVLSDKHEVLISNAAARLLLDTTNGKFLTDEQSADIRFETNFIRRRIVNQCNALRDSSQPKRLEQEFAVNLDGKVTSNWLMSTARYSAVDSETGRSEHRYVIWLNNINELVDARSRMAHADRLSVLGETLAGVAHEVNQPLNTIMLTAENLRRLLEEKDFNEPKIAKKLERIKNQVVRASSLVSRLKGHGKRQEDLAETFRVDDAITSVSEILSPQFTLDGIAFDIVYKEDDYLADGSQTKLEQVISNIAMNARDAILSNKSRKQLETVSIYLNSTTDFEIAIANYGPEIADEHISKVFNPFFTTKQRSDDAGLGLGLSISERLIHELDGVIRVTSQRGRTTFYINIPKPN